MARRNPYYRGQKSDHFDGVRFHSPVEPPARRWLDLARMYLGKPRRRWPAFHRSALRDIPLERVEHLRLASIGHASMLLQLAGLNLLVDPVWAERASPFAFAGPKRIVPPGIDFDDRRPSTPCSSRTTTTTIWTDRRSRACGGAFGRG